MIPTRANLRLKIVFEKLLKYLYARDVKCAQFFVPFLHPISFPYIFHLLFGLFVDFWFLKDEWCAPDLFVTLLHSCYSCYPPIITRSPRENLQWHAFSKDSKLTQLQAADGYL